MFFVGVKFYNRMSVIGEKKVFLMFFFSSERNQSRKEVSYFSVVSVYLTVNE